MRWPRSASARPAGSGWAGPSSSTSPPRSRPEAEARVRQMCDKLLANPVTEDYLLDVEEA